MAVMRFAELGTFDVVHRHLPWPWIHIDPTRRRFAFATESSRIATRSLEDARLAEGRSFELPPDLGLPTIEPPEEDHRGPRSGVHGFALDPTGERLAVVGTVKGATRGESLLLTLGPTEKRTPIAQLTGGDFHAHAVTFDRRGERLWISAENGEATALLLVDAQTHALLGVVKSDPFPPPAAHELWVHPVDDAVLLLAACGQDGTFARVAGWSDGPPVSVPTALDAGALSASFVGFSADGARVHLAESDELRTHAWPGLEELSSVPFEGDFVSSYSGVVLGHRVFVDGQDRETRDEGEDAVMLFDRSGLRGAIVKPPVPTGMWVGRIGDDAIVTVESKGDPSRGCVVRLPAPKD
jgi:hypothetical protein